MAAGKGRVDDHFVTHLPTRHGLPHYSHRPGAVAAGHHGERLWFGETLAHPQVEVVERADHHVHLHLTGVRRAQGDVRQGVVSG